MNHLDFGIRAVSHWKPEHLRPIPQPSPDLQLTLLRGCEFVPHPNPHIPGHFCRNGILAATDDGSAIVTAVSSQHYLRPLELSHFLDLHLPSWSPPLIHKDSSVPYPHFFFNQDQRTHRMKQIIVTIQNSHHLGRQFLRDRFPPPRQLRRPALSTLRVYSNGIYVVYFPLTARGFAPHTGIFPRRALVEDSPCVSMENLPTPE